MAWHELGWNPSPRRWQGHNLKVTRTKPTTVFTSNCWTSNQSSNRQRTGVTFCHFFLKISCHIASYRPKLSLFPIPIVTGNVSWLSSRQWTSLQVRRLPRHIVTVVFNACKRLAARFLRDRLPSKIRFSRVFLILYQRMLLLTTIIQTMTVFNMKFPYLNLNITNS